MQFVKTKVGGNYSPMYVPSDMHSCLVPDRWTCRDVNEIFFADLEILSTDKCLSLFQHWSSNRPIWDWGLQKGGSVVVSMARKKSLWSAELAQSSLSPPLTRSWGHAGHSHNCWRLLSLIWPLIVTTSMPPPDMWGVRCHVCCSVTPTPLMTLGRGPVGKQSYHRKINLAKQLKGTHNSFRAKRTVVFLTIL